MENSTKEEIKLNNESNIASITMDYTAFCSERENWYKRGAVQRELEGKYMLKQQLIASAGGILASSIAVAGICIIYNVICKAITEHNEKKERSSECDDD